VAAVALNELVGPVLFKLSLDRAGESGKAGELPADEEQSPEAAPASGAVPG